MNVSARQACTRPFALAALLTVLGAGAAAGQHAIEIRPGDPDPNDTVVATLGLFGTDSCALWHVAERHGHSIRIEGSLTAIPPCPPTGQSLSLGKLPAGHYAVSAWIDGQTEPYAEVRFDVLATPESSGVRPIDVALATPSPRAGQPTAVVLSFTNGICDYADFSAPPTVVGDRIVFDGELGGCPFEPPPGLDTTGFRHPLPGLTSGDKTIELQSFGTTVATFGFHVDADTSELSVAGGRFRITLRWTDHAGVTHDATAARLTEESGQFWFFDPSNPEVTVKVVDGTAVNSANWVFLSSMTDLGFTATVLDTSCAPGACARERVYTQTPGQNRNFIDTSAFVDCPNCSP